MRKIIGTIKNLCFLNVAALLVTPSAASKDAPPPDLVKAFKVDSKPSDREKRPCKISPHMMTQVSKPSHGKKRTKENRAAHQLTPAQQYAGEILSYLLKVVLGKAGNLKMRKDWASRGLDEKLDLKQISHIMTDHGENELSLIVLDPNIFHLTKVLYYYDERLSVYKGIFDFASIYPSPEIAALRLLFLQKIHRREKINLEALIQREKMWTGQSDKPTEDDLKAMNLSADELRLIKDIIEKEPHLYGYLKSPFLIKTFYDLGAVAKDEIVEENIREANYKKYRCRHLGKAEKINAARIAILPSLIKEFQYGDAHHDLSPYGFKPTEFFSEMTNNVINEILAKTKALMDKQIMGNEHYHKIRAVDREGIWEELVKEWISFYIEDERPLVISPGNAEKVTEDVCPEADFHIILLDKNVYLSIYFNKETDVYPSVHRLYLDVMDIKYSQIQEETDLISQFIWSKLKNELDGIIKRKTKHY